MGLVWERWSGGRVWGAARGSTGRGWTKPKRAESGNDERYERRSAVGKGRFTFWVEFLAGWERQESVWIRCRSREDEGETT
jgi:hypothetical protein